MIGFYNRLQLVDRTTVYQHSGDNEPPFVGYGVKIHKYNHPVSCTGLDKLNQQNATHMYYHNNLYFSK